MEEKNPFMGVGVRISVAAQPAGVDRQKRHVRVLGEHVLANGVHFTPMRINLTIDTFPGCSGKYLASRHPEYIQLRRRCAVY